MAIAVQEQCRSSAALFHIVHALHYTVSLQQHLFTITLRVVMTRAACALASKTCTTCALASEICATSDASSAHTRATFPQFYNGMAPKKADAGKQAKKGECKEKKAKECAYGTCKFACTAGEMSHRTNFLRAYPDGYPTRGSNVYRLVVWRDKGATVASVGTSFARLDTQTWQEECYVQRYNEMCVAVFSMQSVVGVGASKCDPHKTLMNPVPCNDPGHHIFLTLWP